MGGEGFIEASGLSGVEVHRLDRHVDPRGWLVECYRSDEWPAGTAPAMCYLSSTLPGSWRGPHEHLLQTDVLCFPGAGDFTLVLWDNRPGSADFGKRVVTTIAHGAPCRVIIPPRVVHAYRCVSPEPGLVLNLPDRLYGGEGRGEAIDEIRHERDPGSAFLRDLQALSATGDERR